MKTTIYIFCILLSYTLNATVFTSIQNGDYNNVSTWNLVSIPTPNDTIVVKHLVTGTDITINYIDVQKPGYLAVDNIRLETDLKTDTTLIFETLELLNTVRSSNIQGHIIIKDWLDINRNIAVIVDSLTLESTESKTANILTIANNGFLSGVVIVKRHIYNTNRIWRYISSPIQGSSISDWQQEIPISGNYTNADTCCGIKSTSNPSIYIYNETYPGFLVNGWEFLNGSNTHDITINTGQGYSIYVRNNTNRKEYFDTRGTINQGNINIPVSYTKVDIKRNDGWNLIGNPYPCKLDWNKVNKWQRTNISSAIRWTDNTSGTSVQRTYSNGIGIPASTTGIIGHSQAFWIKANRKFPSIYFRESNKADSESPETYYRISKFKEPLRFELKNSNGVIIDETVIAFDDSASLVYDDFDAIKMEEENIIYTETSDSLKTAINFVPDFDTLTIFVKLENTKVHTISLPINLSEYTVLDSNYLLVSEPITINETFSKFYIIRDIITSESETKKPCTHLYPNPITNILNIHQNSDFSRIKIFDSLGKSYFEKTNNFTNSFEIVDMTNYPNGHYLIIVDSNTYNMFKQ
jgi:hypothetical protein